MRVKVGRKATQVALTRVKKVRIKTVTFRSSTQIKSFQHVHIEACADVPEGESAEATLDTLKDFVAKELRRAKEGEVPPEPVGRFRV
jgi:hypothetical protein